MPRIDTLVTDYASQDLVAQMFPYRKLPFGHPATPVPWPTLIRIHSTDGHDAEAQQLTDALNWALPVTPVRPSEMYGRLDWTDLAYV